MGGEKEHDDLLEQRRIKDRKRYAGMSDSQRAAYNAHRRELYHKQGEAARKRRRERERNRYHSLEGDHKKERNARRAKLERDRYNKLSKEDLELRNARRRERAKQKKLLVAKQAALAAEGYMMNREDSVTLEEEAHMHIPTLTHTSSGVKMEHYHTDSMDLHAEQQLHEQEHHEDMITEDVIADAVSAAEEVAEQAIGSIMDDNADVMAAAMGTVHENGGSIEI